jgi:AcrR family transcriptional regulator
MAGLSTGERLHRAALRLFATHGFDGTGIRKIAEEAGITVASLYHYVGTKEDLLERMMSESMSELLTPARAAAEQAGDPIGRIGALVDLHVRRHATHSQLCLVGDTELRSLSPARRARIIALRDEYQGLWRQAIAEGAACGTFAVPDTALATMALLQMCTGVAYWYAPEGRLSLDAISSAFVAMAVALLTSSPTRPTKAVIA